MRKLLLCVLAFGLLAGCQSNGGGAGFYPYPSTQGSSLGAVTSCTNAGVKSLYLATIDSASSANAPAKLTVKFAAAQSIDLIRTLAYISETGNNEPVVFETSTGKQVILNVTSLKVIKDGFIALSFNAMVEIQFEGLEGEEIITEVSYESVSGKALVDMNSGNVYDLSGYDIENMLIDQNYIYITKDSFRSLYKIAFDDLSQAMPLNNGDYTPAGTLYYIVNGRIVAGDHSFDINGVTIPKALTSVLLTSEQSTMTGADGPFSSAIEMISRDTPYIIDRTGNIWGYRSDNNGKYAKFQVSLDDDGNTVVSSYEEFTLNVPLSNPNWNHLLLINGSDNYADHLVIGDKSYYYVKRNAVSGITFEAGASTYGDNYAGLAGNCASYYNGSIYWISNLAIYSMNLSQNVVSEVYNSLNLLNPVTAEGNNITLSISNGTLIFYQYLTATTVGTYALTIGNTEPALLSQSRADIDQIVELSF